MSDLVRRFLGFDTLLGVALVKIVYYVGLLGIAGGVVLGLFALMMSLAAGNFVGAFVQLIAVPTVGAVSLVYWRFLCELFMVQFENHDRLIEIRDKIGSYPQF